jgi:hypothetical protein
MGVCELFIMPSSGLQHMVILYGTSREECNNWSDLISLPWDSTNASRLSEPRDLGPGLEINRRFSTLPLPTYREWALFHFHIDFVGCSM